MNSTILFVCLIFTFVIFLTKYANKLKNKRFYQLLKQFPSYPTYPLIGNTYMIYGSLNDLMGKLEKIMLPHNRLLFWLGPMPAIFLKKYDDIMAISTQSQYRETLGFAHEWVGIGLLTSKYEEWKKSRKILAPAFSSQMLSKYVEVFKTRSAILVDLFRSAADTHQMIDVSEYLMKANLDGIVENTIDISIESREKEGKEFGDAVVETLKEMAKRFITPWLYPNYIYRIYLIIARKIHSINKLQDLPTKVLEEKLAGYRNENKTFGNVDSSKAMIDLLIKGCSQESSFSEMRMRDELLHIMLAATETTVLNVSFLMLQLAINQDIQQKVYEEIVEHFHHSDTLKADHLFNRFKYLEQCIKETSRLYGHVIVTSRRTYKECVLKDNVIIPANMMVVAFLHFVNNDPELYENPEKWEPENFSNKAIENRPNGSFASFGYGPRSCIGARYAMISAKTQIIYILRNYHLSTDIKELTKDQLQIDLSIRSKLGYPIKFMKRQKLSGT